MIFWILFMDLDSVAEGISGVKLIFLLGIFVKEEFRCF